MINKTYDIKTNIGIGEQIFENLPDGIQPGWAGHILSRFDNYINNIPNSIIELYFIIDNEERWKEAHKQFDKIRNFLQPDKNYKPVEYLFLAELVAKVTYNASQPAAPFDRDSGHYIPSTALKAAEAFKDNTLEEEVKSAILLFSRNKLLKSNLNAAKDLLLYKKIDEILWYDWDPIGINSHAPRDEYQTYVPEIFGLVKAGADRNQIAERLLLFETDHIGMGGSSEKCLEVADKVLNAQVRTRHV